MSSETPRTTQPGPATSLRICATPSKSSPHASRWVMVVLVASWSGFRLPSAIATIDAERTGPQNLMSRQRPQDFAPRRGCVKWWCWGMLAIGPMPPSSASQRWVDIWVRHAAHPHMHRGRVSARSGPTPAHVALSSSRPCKPEGRRPELGIMRHAEGHQLGDVTSVLAKKQQSADRNASKPS